MIVPTEGSDKLVLHQVRELLQDYMLIPDDPKLYKHLPEERRLDLKQRWNYANKWVTGKIRVMIGGKKMSCDDALCYIFNLNPSRLEDTERLFELRYGILRSANNSQQKIEDNGGKFDPKILV